MPQIEETKARTTPCQWKDGGTRIWALSVTGEHPSTTAQSVSFHPLNPVVQLRPVETVGPTRRENYHMYGTLVKSKILIPRNWQFDSTALHRQCLFSERLRSVRLVGCCLLFLDEEERLHDRRTCSGNRTTERRDILRECNMMRRCPECRQG